MVSQESDTWYIEGYTTAAYGAHSTSYPMCTRAGGGGGVSLAHSSTSVRPYTQHHMTRLRLCGALPPTHHASIRRFCLNTGTTHLKISCTPNRAEFFNICFVKRGHCSGCYWACAHRHKRACFDNLGNSSQSPCFRMT
jgi:hypothetical protein